MMMKALLLSLPVLTGGAVLTVRPTPAQACGTEAYFGQVCLMATTFCPRDTMELNGQMQTIQDNPALYSLIGCNFGGDCRTTFQLPDLRGRIPVQYGQGAGLANHPMAQYFGQENIVQTTATLAPHSHAAAVSGGGMVKVTARQAPGTGNQPQTGSNLAQGAGTLDPSLIYVDPATTPGTDVALGGVSGGGAIGAVTLATTGAASPIPTVPPEVALRYCIVTSGYYPPRP